MKIVIDIDEDVRIAITRMGLLRIPDEMQKKVDKAIQSGTPLPKGHGRLIDADKTITKICGNSCGCHLEECGHDNPCFSVTRIKSAPTIIEADTESEE